jgi:alpha-1,2-mannosyltransferase
MTILRPLARPAVRRASAIGLAVLLIVFAAQAWRKAHRLDGNDLTSYLASARALAAGENPYTVATPFPYIYPLFLALALLPLAALPYGAAVVLWFAISCVALAWLMSRIARLEDPLSRERDSLPIAAVVIIGSTEVIQSNLLNGQINFVVLALCIAALGGGLAAAGWWGAAIATKVLPIALAPFWILRRRPLLVVAALVVAVALGLLPAVVGGRAAVDWTSGYVKGFVGASLEGGSNPDELRFSLYGIIAPLVSGVPWLPLVAGALVVGAAAAADAWRPGNRDDHVAYSLYLAVIPLASPKSETHHLAFALPAAYLCALRILRYRLGHRDWRRYAFIAAAILFWIGSLSSGRWNVWWFASLVLLCGVTAAMPGTEGTEVTEKE